MNNSFLLQATPLVSLVFTLGLGIIVLVKNPKILVNRIYFLASFTFSIWLFGSLMMALSHEDSQIIFWDRFVYLGVVFMPSLQYHLSLALTENNKIRNGMLYVGYFLSVVFFFLSRTETFISGVFRYEWGIHSIANFWHHVFLISYFYFVFAALFNFLKHYRKTAVRIEKQRLLFLFLAFAFLNIIGGFAFLPAYKISFFTPLSLLAPWVFSILVGYAMIVHRLMDFSMVIKRFSVMLVSVAFVSISAYGLKKIAVGYFFRYPFFADLLITAAAIITYSKVKSYFFRVANKHFFTSLYDSHHVVSEINNKLRSTLDLNKIFNFIFEVINRTFRVDAFAVLFLNKKDNSFLIRFNKGFDFEKKRDMPLSGPLGEIFTGRDKALYLEEIDAQKFGEKNALAINQLREMGVAVIMPLNFENMVSGLIFIGSQKTDDAYSREDLEVLNSVSIPIAMSVKNALLHEDALVFAEKLHAQTEKISAVLSNFIDPIIFIDNHNCLGMINPAAREILGMRQRDIGKDIGTLRYKTEELKRIISENNKQTFGKQANDPKELKEVFVLQSGVQIYYKVLSTEVVSESEEFLGTLKMFYDLTKEKTLDKSKSEFISVAAHQLRTPLSAVKWIIESFLNKELGEVSPEQRQYLGMASISNQKLITTVNEFLNVSKIEAGSLIYDFEACNVNDIITGVKIDVENIAKNKNIKLQFLIEENLPKIMADKRKIFIVIENLISNAINYTPENGKIVVEIVKKDDFLVISVKDNGIGIPKKEMEKIFTKFFRASNAVRVQPDGSGLGLFIIRNIVKIHKGEVLIESEEGVGTKMIVRLPTIKE